MCDDPPINTDNLRIATLLRRHFGALWHGEPTISFHPDGCVQVRVGDQSIELTQADAEKIANENA